jgi:kynurenine formamidase
MKIIDLTHTLENNMTVFPGTQAPEFIKEGNVQEGDAYELTNVSMTSHTGTHIDMTSHTCAGGIRTDTTELSMFMGRGSLVDCSGYKEGEEIGMEILEDMNIENTEYLLFYSAWSDYWKTEKMAENFPCMSVELTQYLAELPGLKGVGIETLSVDPVNSADLCRHNILFKGGKVVVECLTNLEILMGKEFTFMAMPLKFKKGEGSPVKAMAII